MPINKKIILTTTLVVATLSTVVFIAKNQHLSKTNTELVKQFSEERKILKTQLEEILDKYDHLKVENEHITKEKDELQESLLKKNKEESNLNVYANNQTSEGKIQNLRLQNENLKEQVVQIEKKIEFNTQKIHQLEEHPVVDKVKLKQLNAINVNARGVRVMSDLYKKEKTQKIQELRVCFTLEGTEFVGEGNKKIYIQVINPNKQIVSIDKEEITSPEGTKITYSSKIDAFYNQKDTDVCAYVDLEKSKTIKGTYQVNLFYNFKKIGTTTYKYN